MFINTHISNGCKNFKDNFSSMMIIIFLLFLGFYTMKINSSVNILYLNQYEEQINFTTNKNFLSFALDSSLIANGFKNFNMSNLKLIKIIEHLSPAYLRIGGNMADRLIFVPENESFVKRITDFELDGGDCSNNVNCCQFQVKSNFTMNGIEWLKLNSFTKQTKLNMIFDLNVLRRSKNNSWDSENAEKLIEFSNNYDLPLDWQLGNEPNTFKHQFNHEINATQLASDFRKLRTILKKYERYSESLIIGPDTTRPISKNNKSIEYLMEFLKNGSDIINIIGWHQYYFNGKTAKAQDFLNPLIFDALIWEINTIKYIRDSMGLSTKKLWLTETSSAWGGGSPLYSNKFLSSFIWLDKLGVAAKMGIDVVVRQSIFKGYYALIADDYSLNPDYWVSILYKKFVGQRVLTCHDVTSRKVRLYCHCSNKNFQYKTFSSVTVFGMNMANITMKIRIEGLIPSFKVGAIIPIKFSSYTLTTKDSLLSRDIYLNGKILKLTSDFELPKFEPQILNGRPYIKMPPFSIVFWVIPTQMKIC